MNITSAGGNRHKSAHQHLFRDFRKQSPSKINILVPLFSPSVSKASAHKARSEHDLKIWSSSCMWSLLVFLSEGIISLCECELVGKSAGYDNLNSVTRGDGCARRAVGDCVAAECQTNVYGW